MEGVDNLIKFGTGGWRAIIADDFTYSNIRIVAQAVAEDIKNRNNTDQVVVIGYDNRFLSDTAAKLCAEVLAANNIRTLFIDNQAPTPLIMYTVREVGATYGMVITASHNPANYNGIKIISVGGRDANADESDRLEEIISTIDKPLYMNFEDAVAQEKIQKINPLNSYIDAILRMVDIEAIRNSNLKIIIDTMYGVSKLSLQTVLITCRCNVDVINDRHDTLFGGQLPAPSIDTLGKLQRLVLERKADLGLATDGDADRLGIISDKGEFIHPNDILTIMYYYLLKYKGLKGPVVRNIATTHLLDRIADSFGQEHYEVPVGFKYISSKMEETNALLGGESSGGLTIRGHIKGKDGIFAAAILVEAISTTGLSISQLSDKIHETYGQTYFIECNRKLDDKLKSHLMERLFASKKVPEIPYDIDKISYLDGVKIYFKDGGWISARFSGTEPLIRIFCEMDTKRKCENVIDIFTTFLGL